MHRNLALGVVLLAGAASPAQGLHAQDAPAATAPAPTRVMGSLVSIDGQKVTVKDQKGVETSIMLSPSTRLLQVAPGQTKINTATPIQLADIHQGDRLLLLAQPAPDGGGLVATILVAMKQTDIAQQHASETAAWQHGVGGLVKQVDAAASIITIDSRSGGHSHSVTIKITPKTIVKRYAAESVQFEKAQPSTLDKIMAGDQLRARGVPGADPADFAADEIVAGSFRNLSGRLTAIDSAGGLVTLTDLATKQPVQLKVTADSQIRKLDDATAEKLAAAMKPASGTMAGTPAGGPASGAMPGGAPPASGHSGPPSSSHHEGSPVPAAGSGADMQQALAHAPAIQFADLKKGDLVMAVASAGADSQYGAVTMVTGVEPLLRASPNASAAGLSNWSLGAGGAGGGEPQ